MKFFKKVVIGGDPPLLIRYILFRCKAFGIYIHKFCRSDYDRALHDHPWPFVSIILKGGYCEIHDQTTDVEPIYIIQKPGNVLLRPAEWRHRVVLKPRVDDKHEYVASWSFIIVGRRCRSWGFFLPSGWCWWRKYNYDKAICEEEILWYGGSD